MIYIKEKNTISMPQIKKLILLPHFLPSGHKPGMKLIIKKSSETLQTILASYLNPNKNALTIVDAGSCGLTNDKNKATLSKLISNKKITAVNAIHWMQRGNFNFLMQQQK